MTLLIFILVTLILFIGFFTLTYYETRHEMRFCARARAHLDRHVERAAFIFEHVDLGAFLRDETRRLFTRASHDTVHLSLKAVRATERVLTRLVMHLRSRRAVDTAPRENVREFVKTLSDFKGTLKAVHPEVKGEE